MIEVREVIRQWQAGFGLREMARATGLDRKTVRRYVEVLHRLGVGPDAAPDDALVHQVASRVQTRAVPEPSVERELLMAHRERIEVWLTQKKPLRLTKVHALLCRDHGLDVSYSTLRRFAQDELGWGMRKPTVLIADAPPGEEAQVDFGLMGTMLDPRTGTTRKLYALVVTLCFSRYQFVWPTWEQTTASVCEGLDEARHVVVLARSRSKKRQLLAREDLAWHPARRAVGASAGDLETPMMRTSPRRFEVGEGLAIKPALADASDSPRGPCPAATPRARRR